MRIAYADLHLSNLQSLNIHEWLYYVRQLIHEMPASISEYHIAQCISKGLFELITFVALKIEHNHDMYNIGHYNHLICEGIQLEKQIAHTS